ncbi:hypothetical protein QE385_001740 [Sphingomonas sp. SORGH_AS 950]|uniref:hypothetical protein n=1 Tax=Sphingomonas sp. SORGH_AS_0950 TaxID=3041792 RepID=UPI0027820D93|nr:hypothetical protein [Sphingomonas sp. SORGH_AS_0950]MDQ1157413.1 hypothetical protein [Sphingomonas sp. SORGH_AS_0950]
MAEPVSVRAFAKLDGCSHTLVSKAIKRGNLPVTADGLIDPALAGTGWRKRNRVETPVETQGGNTATVSTGVSTPAAQVETPRRQRGKAGAQPVEAIDLGDDDFVDAVLNGRFVSTAQAEQIKENGLAAKNLLAARKEAGDVVDLEVAGQVLFAQARAFRDAWQNWPARTAPLIAAKLGVPVEPVLEALTEHVHQQLVELGDPEADFSDASEA